ncbi:hypothetical protein VTO73DRAFT_11615 [Trametes versicolor]
MDVMQPKSNKPRVRSPSVLSEKEDQIRIERRVAAQNHLGTVTALAVSPDHQWVASSAWESRLILRKAANPSINVQQVTASPARALAFSHSGAHLASVHPDGFRVWNIDYSGPNQEGVDLMLEEIIHNGPDKREPRAVAWLDEDQLARVYSCRQALKTRSLSDAPGPVLVGKFRGALNFTLFSPENALLAFGSGGGRCHIWDVKLQRIKLELPKHESEADNPVLKTFLKAAQFDARGEHIVILSNDGTARVWDTTESGQLLFAVPSELPCVKDVSLSPDGRHLLIVLGDGKAWLSEWWNGRQWTPLSGHKSAVERVYFSPAGRGIASVLSDGTVCFWETRDLSEPQRAFTEHQKQVERLTFSGDDILVFAADDGTMYYTYHGFVLGGTPSEV